MEANLKIIRLVEGLLKATKDGRIHWEPTASRDDFRAPLGSGMVRVGLQFDSNRFEFIVLDGKGREIESVYGIPERPELLADLYHSARHTALKVDDFLDHLIRDVEAKTT